MPRTPSTARKATAAKATSPAKAAGAAAVADAVTSIQSAQARRAGHPSAQPSAPGSPVGAYLEVAIDLIDESPDNPRTVLPELPALAKSIEAVGVIEPVVVVQDGDRFRIVAGHRRVAAAKLANLKSVPAILRTDDAVAEHIHRMVENLQRVDLNPLEEARGYSRLKDLGVKQKTIAEAVGRNQGHVSKRLALLSLPDAIAARIGRPEEAGGITLEQAVDIARLPGRVQIAIAEASHAGDDAKWKGGWDLDNLIRREAQVAERASELVDVVQALRSAKVTVLNLSGDEITEPPSLSAVDGPAPLAWLHLDDRDAHAALPCHALMIRRSPVGGESVLERWTQEVCTDPGSHAAESAAARAARPTETVGVGSALADPAAAADRATKAAAVEEAKNRIAAFVADLVHGKVVGELTSYVLRGQIRDVLLGREYYLTGPVDAAALVDRAEAGDLVELLRFGVSGQRGDKLVRAALAGRLSADLDSVDVFLRDHAFGYEVDVRAVVDAFAFYGFARSLGYEPSELELAALAAVEERGVDGWLREALVDGNLLKEDEPAVAGEPDGPSNRERQLARGVTEDCLARAAVDGVPDTVALEPDRAIPTGRCTTCGGAAKALTMGAAGRHAPGGGSVRKGHPACEGKELVSLDAAEAASTPPVEVACPVCEAVGRDADDRLCERCAGTGLVPAVVTGNGQLVPAPVEVPAAV